MRACENFGRTSGAAFAAGGADKARLDVRQRDVIGPAISADRDVMTATMIPGVDQHITYAECAHFPEGDFWRVGRNVKSGHCTSGLPVGPSVSAAVWRLQVNFFRVPVHMS